MPSGSSLRRKPSQLPDDAFARLFDGLREGVYIGLVSRANADTATLAANPHLRLIFGWPEERPAADVRPIVERMGRVGVHLADQAGVVLRTRDVEQARQLEVEDDLMDDLQRDLYNYLLDPTWRHGVAPAVDISLLARFYERFADHAVSIARRVVYLVTGENVGGDTTPAFASRD